MQRDLENWLYARHPQLFADKDLPPSETALCWGIECGPGWLPLIDTLCRTLDDAVDREEMPPVRVVQIKEKRGRLRFRYRGGNETTRAIIELAANLSERLDQESGAWRNSEIPLLCPWPTPKNVARRED